MRKLLILFFIMTFLGGQEIIYKGEKPETLTYEQALEMLKARDAEWEEKIKKLKEKVYVDSLIIVAKNAHIESQKKQIKVLEILIPKE